MIPCTSFSSEMLCLSELRNAAFVCYTAPAKPSLGHLSAISGHFYETRGTTLQRCPSAVYGLALQTMHTLGMLKVDTRYECDIRFV